MPVWVLNSVTAKWETAAQATRQGGQYCFEDPLPGRINCDSFSSFAYVRGRVCRGGKPAGAVPVHVGQAMTMTSSEGAYAAMVPAGVTAEHQDHRRPEMSARAALADEDAAVAEDR